MEILVLKIFTEVIRKGSFAAVARDRNVDPSSISRAIAGLETELGVRLFQRSTRKLSPTEAGILYFQRLESLLEEMQQAVDLITESAEQPKGTLRVTASVSFGLKCIVPLLKEFERLYSDLTVDLLLTDKRVDLLTERIDLAIRLGKLQDSTLIAQRLMATKYSVCASPEYISRSQPIIQPRDITQHDCLLFPIAGFRSHWLFKDNHNKVIKIPVNGRTIISNAIGLQQCAIAGMGLALLPHWLINSDLESGRLITVLPSYRVTATDFQTSAWLVYPSRTYIPLKVKVFISFLKEHF